MLPQGHCLGQVTSQPLMWRALGGEATRRFWRKPRPHWLGDEATVAWWGLSPTRVCLFSPLSGKASLVSMATWFPVLVFPWRRYLLNTEAEYRVEANMGAALFNHLPHVSWVARLARGHVTRAFVYECRHPTSGDVMESSLESLLRPIFFLSSFWRALLLSLRTGSGTSSSLLRIFSNPPNRRPYFGSGSFPSSHSVIHSSSYLLFSSCSKYLHRVLNVKTVLGPKKQSWIDLVFSLKQL